MKSPLELSFRQVHLDFHTGPDIPDVGVDFDAEDFARTMKDAHVNSVTVFAKCHHGHLYYNTHRPERHPGLKRNLNLLGRQVEVLHRHGIRAPIYLSVQCDEYAANTHPEWVARKPDSAQVKGGGVFDAHWQILDMSTPYQEYLAEQTREVLKLFHPVDGIFFDMCWDQPSTTREFLEQTKIHGGDPQREEDRQKYAHQLALNYMKRFSTMVRQSSRNASVYFNGRSLSNLREEIPNQGQVEIEALPTGGWGYLFFARNIRFARQFGKPCLGMTARFHKSWADFGSYKPYPALEYETSQMIAHGAACSIGDQLHPRGRLDSAAYNLIGKIYHRVADREPWLRDAAPVTEMAVFQSPAENPNSPVRIAGTDEGVTRLLTQLKYQFDFVDAAGDFSKYRLLVLPDAVRLDASLAKKLIAYTRAGGSILASFTSGLDPDATASFLHQFGVKPSGMSPFTTTYMRFDADKQRTDHVIYESGTRVIPARGTKIVARIVEPYFERAWNHFSSHFQTPPAKVTDYAAATLNGRAGYINFPVFGAFARHGSPAYRTLVQTLIAQLLPHPLLAIDGPTGLEAAITRQNKPIARTILHLLQYSPERRAENIDLIEDVVPIYGIPLAIKLDRKPDKVYFAPDGSALDFKFENGRASVVVPEIRGHAMIVFE